MPYKVKKLSNEEELLKALGVSDLAGSDVPDCSRGVLLVRFEEDRPVTAAEISEVLTKSWTGDLPVVITSGIGFADDVLDSVGEYEDVHLFASAS